jgi:GMP synthase (glutamine-hydrolysing)
LGEEEASDQAMIETLLGPHGCTGVVLPLKSVGVQGDARTYRHPAAITGDALRDYDLAGDLSTQITNSAKQVNRVVLHLGGAGPAGLRTHAVTCTRDRVLVLQKADKAAHVLLHEAGKTAEVWQFPVVLAPLSPDGKGESCILRPVYSREAMTAEFARLPWELLEKMTAEILKIDGITSVFFDLTNKPPGTIEWE